MRVSSYLCHFVGENPEQAARFHVSTVTRLKAYAIAMHIPLALWAITGYVIAGQIFYLGWWQAGSIALLCATLIYLVERVVLVTPKVWYVNLARLLIGLIMAVIGASAVDLVIFDREVAQQLRKSGEISVRSEYDDAIAAQRAVAESRRHEWVRAQGAANCEADGTCGSKIRSVGPIYRQLVRQAETLRSEYIAASERVDSLEVAKAQALKELEVSEKLISRAGLLARIQALHDYTTTNTAACIAWVLFFMLILFFELMVVLVKLVFGQTVDDHIEIIREQISQHKAIEYLDAITSPVAKAKVLLQCMS